MKATTEVCILEVVIGLNHLLVGFLVRKVIFAFKDMDFGCSFWLVADVEK